MNSLIQVMKQKRGLFGVGIALAAIVVFAAATWGKKSSTSNYITAMAERHSVEVTVSATGTVQAITTVQVGSQVSGTVAWLGADYNAHVKRGQVIARLDPSTLETQVENARASLMNANAVVQAATTDISNQQANGAAAKANEQMAQAQYEDAVALSTRYAELGNVVSARDRESAQMQTSVAAGRLAQSRAQVSQAEAAYQMARARLDQARAQRTQSQAQLQQMLVNLNHAIITSPIDGVVVSRSVDVGQTVAASLQAPTLFTIANDLTKMRVLASVDEADVGQIHEGINAEFNVDAFPGESFAGTISQIRLEALAQQNVVTYTAVIDVSNPDLKLRPGMTANITIPIAQRKDVLTIPNAALRFKPNLPEQEQQDLRSQLQDWSRGQTAEQDQTSSSKVKDEGRGTDDNKLIANSRAQVVWILTPGAKLEPRFFQAGLTNGRITEVMGGHLQEGDIVVIGQNETGSATSTQQPSSPFGQRPIGGRATRGQGR